MVGQPGLGGGGEPAGEHGGGRAGQFHGRAEQGVAGADQAEAGRIRGVPAGTRARPVVDVLEGVRGQVEPGGAGAEHGAPVDGLARVNRVAIAVSRVAGSSRSRRRAATAFGISVASTVSGPSSSTRSAPRTATASANRTVARPGRPSSPGRSSRPRRRSPSTPSASTARRRSVSPPRPGREGWAREAVHAVSPRARPRAWRSRTGSRSASAATRSSSPRFATTSAT